jgi:hypothetical protein
VRGEYELAVPPGGYSYFIRKQSYETKEMFYIPIFPGAELDAEDTLHPESDVTRIFTTSDGYTDPNDPKTAQIRGRLTDYSGQPIAGAFVTVTDSNDERPAWEGRTVKTDGQGNFKVVGLAGALYDLTLESHDFRTVNMLAIPTAPGYAIVLNQQLSLLRPH